MIKGQSMYTRFSTLGFIASFQFAFFVFPLSTFAETFYVKSGSKGNGSSWSTPFGDLQKALHRAKAGDEILVAAGTYHPTSETNRSESFIIPRGVKLLGGYAGTETKTNERNWETNISILSGNIGSNDKEDNSFHVVAIIGADANTVLDGFVIADGYAHDDRMSGAQARNTGGGLINESYKGKPSTPLIANCIFRNNFAKDGGAVYNNGRGGNASPTFKHCTFEYNQTDLDGGAVYNDGRQQGNANPIFEACHFSNNKGNYGGAVMSYGVNGTATSTFIKCFFAENTAYSKGGAVFNISSQPLVIDDYSSSAFSNNVALDHDTDNVYHHLLTDKNTSPRL
jgi:Protein of unknown function (DUF1565)